MGTVLTLLTAVLVVLKLLGVITISWFWVLVPALVPLVFVFVFLLSFLGMAIGIESLTNRRRY